MNPRPRLPRWKRLLFAATVFAACAAVVELVSLAAVLYHHGSMADLGMRESRSPQDMLRTLGDADEGRFEARADSHPDDEAERRSM